MSLLLNVPRGRLGRLGTLGGSTALFAVLGSFSDRTFGIDRAGVGLGVETGEVRFGDGVCAEAGVTVGVNTGVCG